jgi:adenine C2-methylase RlmN of 23S rRNA A2503 and tRNA A37
LREPVRFRIVVRMIDPPSRAGPEDLLGLSRAQMDTVLAPLLAEAGEPAYRARQVASWIYDKFATRFEDMTDLPAELRARLASRFTLSHLEESFATEPASTCGGCTTASRWSPCSSRPPTG